MGSRPASQSCHFSLQRQQFLCAWGHAKVRGVHGNQPSGEVNIRKLGQADQKQGNVAPQLTLQELGVEVCGV